MFALEADEQISREDLPAAFEEQGMELTCFGAQLRPRPKARHSIDAGIT